MSAIIDEAKALMRKRMEAIEERLLLTAGTGKELAVIETWEGLTMTLRFELVDPKGPFPPNCTVYRVSTIHRNRVSLAQCPQCSERMVADRLAEHLRFVHGAIKATCDHCGNPLVHDASKGHGKRFCGTRCQSANHRALARARAALASFRAALEW